MYSSGMKSRNIPLEMVVFIRTIHDVVFCFGLVFQIYLIKIVENIGTQVLFRYILLYRL